MSTDRPDQNGGSAPANGFQFTLMSLLVTTALAAIFLSCLFAGPLWLAAFAALIVVIAAPVTLITVIVYGRAYRRTFAIGALTFVVSLSMSPYGLLYVFVMILDGEEGVTFRCYVLVAILVGFLLAAAFGLLAVIVRRMVETVPSSPEVDRPTDELGDPFA